MRRSLLLVVAAVGLTTTGCIHLLTPPGSGPLRYRDAVFTNVTVTSGISYGSAVDQLGNTQTLKLDMYEPAGDAAPARPVIVWVHGGGFSGGSRTSPELVDESNVFAKQGYVNVSISYRLAPQGCVGTVTASCVIGILHAQYDAQAAVRWLRANAAQYRIDVNRIAMGGSSAGAITALNVGFSPDDVGTSGTPGERSDIRAVLSLSGARLHGTPDPGEPASLLFHGTADPLVPYVWATDTQAAASAAGLVSIVTTWEGDGHVPYLQHRQEILDQSSNFLYWTMDLEHAAQS